MKISRTFAMPSANTFSIEPITRFIARWSRDHKCSVDPFARDSTFATYTNDLSPNTRASYHIDAEKFCVGLAQVGLRCDFALFDPPYSPRQISECYNQIGLEVGREETQNARLYKRVRDALDQVMDIDGVVLSFGWNSSGMGKGRGYVIEEILLVAHGGAHNDTICIAERKNPRLRVPHNEITATGQFNKGGQSPLADPDWTHGQARGDVLPLHGARSCATPEFTSSHRRPR